MPSALDSANLSRQYVKLCDLPDFDDPQFRARLREIVAAGYEPREELRRKFWEYAMLGLYLDEVGALREDAEALAVAAGHEEPLFWLVNRISRVVAIDLYGEGSFAEREADASMLTDPKAYAPYPYREDRLSVKRMNALELAFPDESFDIVFSLSSIEHFGGPKEVERAAREMSRVLRPDGHLIIVTECLLTHHPLDWAPLQYVIRLATLGRRCPKVTPRKRVTDTFTAGEIERFIVRPTGLKLVQPLDTRVSTESFVNLTRWVGPGELHPTTGDRWPHILLKAHGAPWTSAFLALSKPA
ncbi:MAG: class I SAM-dependent methyltransferase [Actinobacteria bacterium]|nr:MAG: class I SAM-dependent methyltransferase [Actinomycetota bacterium]